MSDDAKADQQGDSPRYNSVGKFAILTVAAVTAASAFWFFGDRLSFDYLAAKETELRSYRQSYPLLMVMIAIAVYIAVAGLSLPGAAVLTLACGWIFGFWQGLLVVSMGSTAGATLAFLLTRYLLKDWVQQRFSDRLETINSAFDREGAFYLFTLRLIPAIPFFVINAVMGLTKIRVARFWWVSQLGMLPGTAAYVYAGATVPSITQLADIGVEKVISWQLLLAFAILGVMPLFIKRILSMLTHSYRDSDQAVPKATDKDS